MPAQLVSLTDGPSILLDKPILLVGRHPECDILIDSRKISRRHCCIAQVSEYLVVRDLGSTNGIRINGVRILEGRLHEKDELTIGGNRYRVSWQVLSDDASPPPPRSKREVEPAGVALHAFSEDDDHLLEECEEPIPLAEPARPAQPNWRKPDRDAALHQPPADRIIVPEDLELAPASDSQLRSNAS